MFSIKNAAFTPRISVFDTAGTACTRGSVLLILPVLAVFGQSVLLILPVLAVFGHSVLLILSVLAVIRRQYTNTLSTRSTKCKYTGSICWIHHEHEGVQIEPMSGGSYNPGTRCMMYVLLIGMPHAYAVCSCRKLPLCLSPRLCCAFDAIES